LHIMPVAIVPEAIDAGIAEGLAASEGIWNGVITFAHKISAAIAAFAMGVILDLAGYVPGVEAQKPSAIAAILFLVCIAPAALSLAGVMVARGFSIDRSEAKRIEEKIG
ncbi:MAG TPA: MFS transporter, partial [Bacillota bacterium]|nr:MFS transporter [Bacillota bacterium]